MTKDREICTSAPDGGWRDDRVDCNWRWDGEEAGPISDICTGKVVGEKIFMIDTVDGLNCKCFGLRGGNKLVSFLFWTSLNSLKFLMKSFHFL